MVATAGTDELHATGLEEGVPVPFKTDVAFKQRVVFPVMAGSGLTTNESVF
jgi:hypothetical protein